MLFLWLVLIQLAIFTCLVFFLRILLVRNVSHATNHLQQMNEDYNQKLEDAKKRQIEAEKYYDQTILKTKTDAEREKVRILKEAHQTQERVVEEAHRQAEEIIAQANRAKEELLKEVDRRVDERSVDRAGEFVEIVLSSEMNAETHQRFVDEFLKLGLEDLERLNLPEEIVEAEIETAFDLNPKQKSLLQKKLEESLKRPIRLKEKTEPRLIAGFKVKLGAVLIDGSLKFRIKEAARHAKHLSVAE